jgi:pyruvate kinase
MSMLPLNHLGGCCAAVTQICLAQKWMVNKAQVVGKPVFIAHQLLSSMTLAESPSLAEMTDVTNAVLDGVDGIVLTAETEAGHHGPESVAQASKILTNAEVRRDAGAPGLLLFPYGAACATQCILAAVRQLECLPAKHDPAPAVVCSVSTARSHTFMLVCH